MKNRLILLIFFGYVFFQGCDKKGPLQTIEPMDSFNPEFYFEPIMVPIGLSSSSDSMAQVVNHYLTLANSVQDYKRFYTRPEDYNVWDIIRTNKTGFQQWELYFNTFGIEIHNNPVGIRLKVSNENERYVWLSLVTFSWGPFKKTVDFPYLESSTTKDFSSGFMIKSYLHSSKYEGYWEWEIDTEKGKYTINIIIYDLGDNVYPGWQLISKTPGKVEIVLDSYANGSMFFYRLENYDFIQDFYASWLYNGSGRYTLYGKDINGNITVIKQGKW